MNRPKTIYTRYLYHHYTTFEGKDGVPVTYGRAVCLDSNDMPAIYNIPVKHRHDWDILQSIDAVLFVKLDLWVNEKGLTTAYLTDYRERDTRLDERSPDMDDLPM